MLADEAKRQKLVGHRLVEDVRFNERRSVERVNGRIKDGFGDRDIRVRGHNNEWLPHAMVIPIKKKLSVLEILIALFSRKTLLSKGARFFLLASGCVSNGGGITFSAFDRLKL